MLILGFSLWVAAEATVDLALRGVLKGGGGSGFRVH